MTGSAKPEVFRALPCDVQVNADYVDFFYIEGGDCRDDFCKCMSYIKKTWRHDYCLQKSSHTSFHLLHPVDHWKRLSI
jgi:hypothetical protein